MRNLYKISERYGVTSVTHEIADKTHHQKFYRQPQRLSPNNFFPERQQTKEKNLDETNVDVSWLDHTAGFGTALAQMVWEKKQAKPKDT